MLSGSVDSCATRCRQVRALLLRGRLESDGGEVAAQVSEPRLHHFRGHQVNLVQHQHNTLGRLHGQRQRLNSRGAAGERVARIKHLQQHVSLLQQRLDVPVELAARDLACAGHRVHGPHAVSAHLRAHAESACTSCGISGQANEGVIAAELSLSRLQEKQGRHSKMVMQMRTTGTQLQQLALSAVWDNAPAPAVVAVAATR